MTFKLLVTAGANRGKVFLLEQGENLIGRWDADSGAFPEVDLEGDDPEVKVSRKHALILVEAEHAWIEDLGSRNGTFVNRSERLREGARHALTSGDEIMIGKIVLTLLVD